VFKIFSVLLPVLLLSACEQAHNSALSTTVEEQESQAFCLTTQSECQINTDLGNFEVTFSQALPRALENKTENVIAGHTSEKGLKHIRTELPFSIIIKPVNSSELTAPVSAVSGYLEGRDMFMGKVPVFFNKAEQGDKFTATSLLASCSEDVMVWQLWLTVTLADKQKSEQRFFVNFESLRL
jgi:hypothetical protein